MPIRERIAMPGATGTRLPPVIAAAPKSRLRAVAVAIALAALAGAAAGCGNDSEAPASTTAPTSDRVEPGGGEGAGSQTEGDRDLNRDRATEPETADEPDASGDGECVFEAPPGRLAQERIVVELAGIGCDVGRQLALAAAVGQPAGANLDIEVGAFDCRPSTSRKGVNVTYTCAGERGEASFDVVWSSEPGG
jgi:hypothetical protein